MRTGLENTKQETLEILITNLKSGVLKVIDMGPAALVSDNPKECPPAAAFETNMMILQAFEAECLRRGIDFDSIGPNIREVEDRWLEARQ
ncbi:hypothetical protein SEA_BELFORT_222 [Streptomyces phage Belfort]|uniref:Uncharacterized protein n=1 Tax=Streptomyces phage Belfort TaxID=2801887 RepID=A0A7T8C3X3_9CAUD|nr:hypothetical protein SEA_BELFORT_222 [Streptomyces phage Belfort]QZE11784.1 hypothetical protein SEA_KARP_218 [Streptomyces phage Karp]